MQSQDPYTLAAMRATQNFESASVVRTDDASELERLIEMHGAGYAMYEDQNGETLVDFSKDARELGLID